MKIDDGPRIYWLPPLLIAVVIQLLIAREARAYIDPGSVSFFFQALMAGVLGGLFALKHYWSRIRKSIRSLFSPGKEDGGT